MPREVPAILASGEPPSKNLQQRDGGNKHPRFFSLSVLGRLPPEMARSRSQRFSRPVLLTLLVIQWCSCFDADGEVLDAAEELCQAEIDAFAACTERAIAGQCSERAPFRDGLLARRAPVPSGSADDCPLAEFGEKGNPFGHVKERCSVEQQIQGEHSDCRSRWGRCAASRRRSQAHAPVQVCSCFHNPDRVPAVRRRMCFINSCSAP